MLAELLRRPEVTEELSIRSRFGFMAFHGGELEKVTDVIAREAADRAGASYYGLLQRGDDLEHLPSTEFDPGASPTMSAFMHHVDVVLTVHGYGHKTTQFSVLLGGRNRRLARHVASHLRPLLPGYDICDDLAHMPKRLRGQHAANPVNRPRAAGVQIELPATIRWNWQERGWSDHGVGRAPQVDRVVRGLVTAARTWAQA